MVWKTTALFNRKAKTFRSGGYLGHQHVERVRRETWWLCGLIPLYVRDSIEATNL